MKTSFARAFRNRKMESGTTLLELIVTLGIMLVLSTAAIATVRFRIIRDKEWELRRDLREMRNAIDKYKDTADRNLIRTEVGSQGYPPDLEALVNGLDIGPSGPRLRFLRRIPVDPMTGRTDWIFQSVQDDPDSTSWSGGNVFDVHSSSRSIALDGTPYITW